MIFWRCASNEKVLDMLVARVQYGDALRGVGTCNPGDTAFLFIGMRASSMVFVVSYAALY